MNLTKIAQTVTHIFNCNSLMRLHIHDMQQIPQGIIPTEFSFGITFLAAGCATDPELDTETIMHSKQVAAFCIPGTKLSA